MNFFARLWHPAKAGEDAPAEWIAPLDLLRHSFLAGATFAVGGCVILLDLTCVTLLAIGYSYARTWARDSNLLESLPSSPLSGIAASILATCLWYGMQLCLTIDILLALSTTSRDLQEGSVYSYGIVSVWQVPLMFICLGFQLNRGTEDWVKEACSLNSLRPSCDDWWKSIKAAAVAPTVVALLLHLGFFLFALVFCRTRSAKSLRPIKAKESGKENKSPASAQARPEPSSPPCSIFQPRLSSGQSASESEEDVPPPRNRTSVGGSQPWLLHQLTMAPIELGGSSPPQLELGHEDEARSNRRSRRSAQDESDDEPLLEEGRRSRAR